MNKHTDIDAAVQALNAAREAGRTAHTAGKVSVPSLDPACMELIGRGDAKTIDILMAWTSGWHQANAAR